LSLNSTKNPNSQTHCSMHSGCRHPKTPVASMQQRHRVTRRRPLLNRVHAMTLLASESSS